jgi:pimeloyl-ACP methyl ester carboxylesterase
LRIHRKSKKVAAIVLAVLISWTILAQTLIFENRWSDAKSYRVFKAKGVPLQIFDTTINNRHLHYAVSGADSLPTLVFIHGSPGSWMNYMKFMWDSAMQKKFRMVSIDRPGFGYSDFGKAMHLSEQAELILPVLQKLKTGKPMILCGHSIGGPLVVQMAAMDTNLFSDIIITGGSIDHHQEVEENWRNVMAVKPLYWLLPGAFGPSNKELLLLKDDLIAMEKTFEKVQCNIHFIHGDKDTWVPIANIAYGMEKCINASSISSDTLIGAGHQIPWANQNKFNEILLNLPVK